MIKLFKWFLELSEAEKLMMLNSAWCDKRMRVYIRLVRLLTETPIKDGGMSFDTIEAGLLAEDKK